MNRLVGAHVHRVEDPRILTGRGRYVDDIVLPGMQHAAFVRSPFPHARIAAIDVDAARALPGVLAVYTAAELTGRARLLHAGGHYGLPVLPPSFPALADVKVRFVGDPVALVVAESRAVAEDGCELIEVDYDPLPAVTNAATALAPDAPLVFDELGANLITEPKAVTFGDVDATFAAADRVLSLSFDQHRHQNVPMETRGSIASWDPVLGELLLHTSTQSPHLLRRMLAPTLDLPEERVRVVAGDVGGAFGLKIGASREDVAISVASRDLGLPVKWIEDRYEHLMASGQARDERLDVDAAVTAEGVVLGLKVRLTMDQGAYPAMPAPSWLIGMMIMRYLPGASRLQALSFDATTVVTNKCSYVAYRGPWAAETFLRERLLDIVARQVGIDQVEVRRRNLARRGEEPTHTVTGLSLAGITALESLERAVELLDLDELRARQAELRASGRHLGIGLATFIEPPGPRQPGGGVVSAPPETAILRLEPDGTITLATGQTPHGQGHETTLAQVAADNLGVPFTAVRVVCGDTARAPYGMTGGSRSAGFAGGAALHGARALRELILSAAAELLEANVEDLELVDGVVAVRGTPTATVSLADVARRTPTELRVTQTYDGGEGGWSGGTHACVVEVDVETGLVRIERYLVVEDCGVVINPAVVEGQIRGGVAQGIGAVLLERSAYGDDGQYLSATFMDYLVPTAMEIPEIEVDHLETVPLDPHVNFRGVGEGGMIVAPATLANAIEDALAPFGVEVREQHLPPARLLELLGTIAAE